MVKQGMTDTEQVDHLLSEAAQILRTMLLEVKKHAEPLPLALNTDHFQKGQASTPERCVRFIFGHCQSRF